MLGGLVEPNAAICRLSPQGAHSRFLAADLMLPAFDAIPVDISLRGWRHDDCRALAAADDARLFIITSSQRVRALAKSWGAGFWRAQAAGGAFSTIARYRASAAASFIQRLILAAGEEEATATIAGAAHTCYEHLDYSSRLPRPYRELMAFSATLRLCAGATACRCEASEAPPYGMGLRRRMMMSDAGNSQYRIFVLLYACLCRDASHAQWTCAMLLHDLPTHFSPFDTADGPAWAYYTPRH